MNKVSSKREISSAKGDSGRESTSNDDSNIEHQPQRRGRERMSEATATACKHRATESEKKLQMKMMAGQRKIGTK